MKKILSTLAIAALSLSAAAQLVPSTFNYQGATDKANQEITVSFVLVDEAGTEVYTQNETLTTTPGGTFTAVIGINKDAEQQAKWYDIKWEDGGYTLKTSINNALVSEAPLLAVPYAVVAKRVADQDYWEDKINTNFNNIMMKADVSDVADLRTDVEGIDQWIDDFCRPALNDIVEGVRQNTDDIATLDHGMVELTQDLNDVMQEIRESYYTKEEQDLINDNLEMLVPQIQAIHEELDLNVSEHEMLLHEIENVNEVGIILERRMNEAEAAILTNASGLAEAEGTLVELTPIVKGLQAHAAEQDLINDNLELLVPQIEAIHEALELNESEHGYFVHELENVNEIGIVLERRMNEAEEAITTNANGLAEAENTLVELTPIVKGLQAHAAEQDLINDNLELLIPQIEALYEKNEETEQVLAYVTSDVQGLQEMMRGKANAEDLQGMETAIEYISSDVQGLQEMMRGKADIQDYTSMKEEIDVLRRMIKSLQDAVADIAAMSLN